MAETAVYFKDPKQEAFDLTGAGHVSTGFASMRVTVVLAVSALGKKLAPLVIWKGAANEKIIVRVGSV
ncbi:LOW QUALITY PROTEIN: hypothetical protein PHMEG_00032019 [Phytophthora megakarya]|uniref:Uncharacterized protein n=1 Tax=Phytophthora megakarya TaxID=4795 RepID=A0A225UWN9_9STRA|nr:LOW QUALITY PROTEIN: hypothetical protein PHMEG_00032019 [Phytophthora megakarya]